MKPLKGSIQKSVFVDESAYTINQLSYLKDCVTGVFERNGYLLISLADVRRLKVVYSEATGRYHSVAYMYSGEVVKVCLNERFYENCNEWY